MNIKSNLIGLILVLFIGGCSSFTPIKTTDAKLGQRTNIASELAELPPPAEKIVCAVYKFRDQTGQYKPSQNGASWSTAVTQGATSILIKALEESNWFIPIEREGLSNLLNERKIIRSSRANYTTGDGNQLPDIPPLLYAGIMLEGGIISYETNIITGGAGLKYFGTGASGQYRQDQVTIYLRAVSTQNGRVLKTVYTTKTILSQLVDVGLFKFVELKRLLEIETGFSYNEPPQLCVTAAIEKAVQSLVVEGILSDLWNLKDPSDINSDAINRYLKEKRETENSDQDYIAQKQYENRYGVGLSTGLSEYSGDYANSIKTPTMELNFTYNFDKQYSVNLDFGGNYIEAERAFERYFFYGGANVQYYFNSLNRFSPFVTAGIGWYLRRSQSSDDSKLGFDGDYLFINSGIGLRYLLNKNIGLNLLLGNNYFLNDKIDDTENGKYNDYLWRIKAGVNYYF